MLDAEEGQAIIGGQRRRAAKRGHFFAASVK